MKQLRKKIDKTIDRWDKQWQQLPIKKQRLYTLYFFIGYLLLSGGIIFKVWFDLGQSREPVTIEHLEHPVLPVENESKALQDTVSIILKKNE